MAKSAEEIAKMPEFKLDDIGKHKSEKDIWISIKGLVYDVTDYLNDHPGGVEIMMQHAGQEATEAFTDIGHSKSAHSTLAKYVIGRLAEGEVVASASRSSKGHDSSGGSMLMYLLGAAALAAALYFQFLRKQ